MRREQVTMATSHVPFAFRMPPRGDRKAAGSAAGRRARRSKREEQDRVMWGSL